MGLMIVYPEDFKIEAGAAGAVPTRSGLFEEEQRRNRDNTR